MITLLAGFLLFVGLATIICFAGNWMFGRVVQNGNWKNAFAFFVTPFVPALLFYFLVFDGLMPWNAAGLVMFYPVLHIIFIVVSFFSLWLLDRFSNRSQATDPDVFK